MDLLETFEEHLRKKAFLLETFHPFYQEALNYMLEAGGKRFRPMLLLHVVQAYEPLLIPSALDAALAIEMLHTYSLIHDDLPAMDDADLRRGRASLHKRFDETTAILVGDGLNTHAFYLLSQAALGSDVKTALVRELSLAGGIGGMVHGQIIDCYFENKKLTLEELKTLHINKTAKLIAASLKMGAIIVGLDVKEQEELYLFGIRLGLLFQIQDDLIDALSTREAAGKTINNDTDKNSFVKLMGVEGAYAECEKMAAELMEQMDRFRDPLKKELRHYLQTYIYRHHTLKGDNGQEDA